MCARARAFAYYTRGGLVLIFLSGSATRRRRRRFCRCVDIRICYVVVVGRAYFLSIMCAPELGLEHTHRHTHTRVLIALIYFRRCCCWASSTQHTVGVLSSSTHLACTCCGCGLRVRNRRCRINECDRQHIQKYTRHWLVWFSYMYAHIVSTHICWCGGVCVALFQVRRCGGDGLLIWAIYIHRGVPNYRPLTNYPMPERAAHATESHTITL